MIRNWVMAWRSHMPSVWNLGVLTFVLAPLVVVIMASFNGGEFTAVPPENPSLRWYEAVIRSDPFRASFFLSTRVAVETVLLALPIGVTAALTLTRTGGRWTTPLRFLSIGPLLFPQVLLGLGLLNLIVGQLGLQLNEMSLVAGHVLVTTPFVVGVVSSGLSQIDPNLESAARSLGANPLVAFWTVTFPNIRGSVAAAGIFAFIFSFDNIGISLFLSVPGIVPLPIRMYEYVTYRYDPTIAAASTILILISLAAFLAARRLVNMQEVFGRSEGGAA